MKCSHCGRYNAQACKISEKEIRHLCQECIAKNRRRDDINKPNYVNASKLSSNMKHIDEEKCLCDRCVWSKIRK